MEKNGNQTDSQEPTENNADAYIKRGIAYVYDGDYDRAITAFDKAIELDENNAKAYVWRGRAYYIKDDYDRAITDFDKAIELDRNDVNTYINRGIVYRSKHDYDRAITNFDKAIELDKNNASAHIERGITYHFNRDYDCAIKDHNKAIKLDKNNAYAYHNRGITYYYKGNHDRAITDYNKAIELDQDNANIYICKGDAYYSKGNYDHAIKDFDKAIDLGENNANIYIRRGLAHYCKRNYDLAITDFDEAIKIEPNREYPYRAKGYAYYNMGDYDRSLDNLLKSEKFESSIKFNDEFVYIAFHLKETLQSKGEILKLFYYLLSTIHEIRNKLFYKPGKKKEIAHYTSFHTLKNLSGEERCFRIYNAAYMNDPEEGEVFSAIMEPYGVNLKDDFYPDRTSYISPAYIGSFVIVSSTEKQKDKLFLWRTYGKHDSKEAEGACLVFKHNGDCFVKSPIKTIGAMLQQRDITSRQNPTELALYKIAYKNQVDGKLKSELTKLANLLKEIKRYFPDDNLSKLTRELLDEIRFLFKEDHYKEEKEVRVVRVCYFKEENKKQESDEIEIDTEQIPPRFYLETDKSLRFHEVILGPNTKNPSEWKKWLKQQRDDLEITPSNAKYRNS